jgi:hypothetical protein
LKTFFHFGVHITDLYRTGYATTPHKLVRMAEKPKKITRLRKAQYRIDSGAWLSAAWEVLVCVVFTQVAFYMWRLADVFSSEWLYDLGAAIFSVGSNDYENTDQ